jgi:UDP-3-O-[3-hydroxymyristoyl] glucosamine N-acyltransferase
VYALGAAVKASELAASLGARVVGASGTDILRAAHPLEASRRGDVAVAISQDMIKLLGGSPARIAMVPEGAEVAQQQFETIIFLQRSRANLPDITQTLRHRPAVEPGVHPSAVIARDAVIGEGASIGPLVVIGAGARIGARSVILSQATVAEGATLGDDCLVYPGVRIGWDCQVGDRVILHHNVSIGADGFSFVPVRPGAVAAAQGGADLSRTDPSRNPLRKVHSLSHVVIGDDVEVGALTSIDRGTLKPTRIGAGTKIDNLVMIGHNVDVGVDCLLCGQVGLAGSVTVGDGAVLGGRVGVADHMTIGARAVVGGGSGVGTNIPPGAVYMGYPAVPRTEAFENLKLMRRLRKHFAEVLKAPGAGQDPD